MGIGEVDVAKICEIMGPLFGAIASDAVAVMATLDLPHDADILDVGTGEGYFAIFLAANGYHVLTGEPESDSSRYAGKKWQEVAEKLGVQDKIKYEFFTAEKMPFQEKSFNAVFFFGVLHHINVNLRKDAFREAVRVAKDKGVVVFFEPKRETLEKVWVKDPEHPDAACPEHYASGLEITETRMTGSLMDVFIFRRS